MRSLRARQYERGLCEIRERGDVFAEIAADQWDRESGIRDLRVALRTFRRVVVIEALRTYRKLKHLSNS